jgi:hypothetical protein
MVSTQRNMSDELKERSVQGDNVSKNADDMDADNKDEDDETDKRATHVSTFCSADDAAVVRGSSGIRVEYVNLRAVGAEKLRWIEGAVSRRGSARRRV